MSDTATPPADEIVVDTTSDAGSSSTAPTAATSPAATSEGDAKPGVPGERIAIIGAMLAVIWLIHLTLDFVDGLGEAPLAGAVFLIGITAFFGFSSCGLGMRTTITATFISMYMALLAAFLTSAGEREGVETQVGEQVWEGFTWLVGVIVISYFGASVASEAIGRFRDPAQPGSTTASSTTAISTTANQ